METAKVYYTDFRTTAFGESMPAKLKRLARKAGMADIDMDGKFVAIKMHFGELGNLSYLRPNYAKAIVDLVVMHGGRTTLGEILPAVVGRNWLDIDAALHEKFPVLGDTTPMHDAIELRKYYNKHASKIHIDFPMFKDAPVEVHFTPSTLKNPFTNKKLQQYFSSL